MKSLKTVSFPCLVSAGQLGDRGGPEGRAGQHPGAGEPGGLSAEETEMAHEGMAQGEHPENSRTVTYLASL